MICTICSKSECCKETFREVVSSLRFDYILSEYGSLSDAWRVYQGVALYREYRGIGGETKTLDTVPRPCHLCLVKIVNMAQAIYQVTSALDMSLAPDKVKSGQLSNGRVMVDDDDSSDGDSENEDPTKDKHELRSTLTSPLQNMSLKQSLVRKQSVKEENDDLENEIKEEAEEESRVTSRPRRSAGRSLFERKPDFALGTEFAKILRQRTMKEKSRIKKMRKQLLESTKPAPDESEGWKSSKVRSEQLSRLDSALASSGWGTAIKSGKHMENELFKESQSEAAYISGIDQLVMHFKKGASTSKPEDLHPVKSKRVIKPSRKILDGLDFRRKVVAVKVACSQCGLKVVKSKLKNHMETLHTRVEQIEDNGSEFSVASSIVTHASSSRSQNRSKASSSIPVPDNETELAEKIIDEFADSNSEEESEAIVASSADYSNNVHGGRGAARKCSLEDNDLAVEDCKRPQRRKRSLEERHPDFLMTLPSKIVRKSSSESLLTQLSNKSNEI